MDKQTAGMSTAIGIDAGGTLVKIAYIEDGMLRLRKYPAAELSAAVSWIHAEHPDAEICLTGGRSAPVQSLLRREAGTIVEFDATCNGVRHLLKASRLPLESFVLTNVGTGTSVHHVTADRQVRIGGTGVGGGTLMGLSDLLTGFTRYEEIVDLARNGRRERIDLKVSHIYEGGEPPIPGDLTASNFGNVGLQTADRQPSDMLASVIGLVGETVTTVSVLAAGQYGVSTVVYIGSSFIGNDLLKEIVVRYTRLRGAEPVLLNDGEYSGAIGALMTLRELPG